MTRPNFTNQSKLMTCVYVEDAKLQSALPVTMHIQKIIHRFEFPKSFIYRRSAPAATLITALGSISVSRSAKTYNSRMSCSSFDSRNLQHSWLCRIGVVIVAGIMRVSFSASDSDFSFQLEYCCEVRAKTNSSTASFSSESDF